MSRLIANVGLGYFFGNALANWAVHGPSSSNVLALVVAVAVNVSYAVVRIVEARGDQ